MTEKKFVQEKDKDIIDDFYLETAENIDRAEKLLAVFERDGGQDSTRELFRIFHTIKGDAFALELDVLGKTAHNAENMLDLLRKGAVKNTRGFIGVLYAFCAMIKETASVSGEKNFSGASPDGKTNFNTNNGQNEGYLKIKPEKARALMAVVLKLTACVKTVKFAAEKVKDRKNEDIIFMLKEIEKLSHILPQLFTAAGGINMVSLTPVMKKMENAALTACRASGKTVSFVYNLGADEADRSVAERISEPLAHIIRNAIGHGIETPEERVIKGKNPEGRITLNTYSDEGNFFVSVRDDGKGISAEDIMDKAVKTGAAEAGSIIDDTGILKIITHPGFSTASGIDSVSGRGVGLDVVRQYVEDLRGNLTLKTKKGEGSTFIIRLPASINVIDGVKIVINGRVFLLPEAYVSSVMCVFENNIVREKNSDFIYSGCEKIKCVETARIFGGIRRSNINSRIFCVLMFEGLKAALECDLIPVTESCMTAAVECIDLKKTYYSGAAFDKKGVPVLITDCVKIIREVNNGD
ncbi:MAG: Hpt domain-containing protein [Candidatus Goldbacteria bacterium]|nr:Hpt domain-containing protein [Candidatus Goldiibacteriota bacterium]